jgi:hypothetical protein
VLQKREREKKRKERKKRRDSMYPLYSGLMSSMRNLMSFLFIGRYTSSSSVSAFWFSMTSYTNSTNIKKKKKKLKQYQVYGQKRDGELNLTLLLRRAKVGELGNIADAKNNIGKHCTNAFKSSPFNLRCFLLSKS